MVRHSTAADRWMRVYATRVRQAVQRARHVRRHSPGDWRPFCTTGAFVTIVSMPMTAVLLVAMFKVHLPYGFSSIKLLAVTATGAKFGPVGYEVILLYIACLGALVIGGSGPFAIDGLVRKALEARTSTSRIPQ